MKTYSRKNSSYLRKAFVGSNFDEMCRLCLSEVDLGLKPIFQELGKISYQEWIRYSVDVLVEEGDGLPPNVCEECLLMVEQIYLFKKKCKASDAKLREHLELLELDEGGKFNEIGLNNFTEDKDVFAKEEPSESNCDESSAVDSGGTDNSQTDQPDGIQPDIVSTITPDPVEETQPQEKVQVKRYILKGEIRADNQEEDLTVCEVVPLEDKVPTYTTLECVSENGLSETVQENRIQEIYKLWDNEEEAEPEQVSVEDEGEIEMVTVEGNVDKNKNAEENGVIEMEAVYTNENQMVIMQTIPDAIKYKCFACHKIFAKSTELAEHLTKFHQNVAKPVFCKTCGKSFTCPNSLKRHMTVHTGIRPYQCHICNRKFSQGSILKRHELTHNALKPFNCEICGKSYTQKMNLLTHLKNHGFGSSQDRFRCTVCSKSFVHQSGLSRHTKMHQGVRYLCVKCKKSFVDSSALARHMKTSHSGPG